jgi:para-aminobenzoate synthetase/4-amino-4-deoxychorismate lyase
MLILSFFYVIKTTVMNNKNKLLLGNFFEAGGDGLFFHTSAGDKTRRSYLFVDPAGSIECKSRDEIPNFFKKINDFLKRGYFIAGYFSYELGYCFEKKLTPFLRQADFPPGKLWVFKHRHVFNNFRFDKRHKTGTYMSAATTPELSGRTYCRNISKIKGLIKEGEVYQINYCFNLNFNFRGSAAAYFADLTEKQSAGYSAFVRDKNRVLLSLSPELFFKKTNNNITMKPMKGTLLKPAPRNGLANFIKDKKTIAENVMIVDLIRNDLGKICELNSIKVPKLFETEEYETLWQMTSTIKGRLKKGVDLHEIFSALFPCGSVTGAPKIRAMEVIHDMEAGARGVYTGAIGFMSPDGRAVFNVPIRTASIDLDSGKGVFGTGSGVVHNSTAKDEYKECLGKAGFVSSTGTDFRLIETMLYNGKNGYRFYKSHLLRLKKSAIFFNIPFREKFIRKKLKEAVRQIRKGYYRIRLLVDKNGNADTERSGITRFPFKTPTIAVFGRRTNSADIFLSHKTSRRAMYNEAFRKASKKGIADYIFMNENNEITEGCISNIFLKKKDIYYTPPLKCGLLPGIYREHLLNSEPDKFKEKLLYKKDLLEADEIYLCNSTRGLYRVCLL